MFSGKFLLTCLALSLVLSSQAQDYSYSIRNYKAMDGLPQSQVNIMLEDRNGYLWIGTHGGGLARFDGREFKVYTTMDGLLSNIITNLRFDAQQNLWVVHPRGISRFNGVAFKKFSQQGAPAGARRIGRAFEVGDTLCFVSAPGTIVKIYDDSVLHWSKEILPGKRIRHCHIMPDKRTLLYLNDSSFLVKTGHGDVQLTHKGTFGKLYEVFNYAQKVWLTTDKGRFTLDVAGAKYVPASLPLKNQIVCADTLNNVWWTRRGNDLMRERISGGTVRVDTVLKDVGINQVLVDSEGNTWFATHGMGLYKYFIQDFNRYGPEDMNVVMAIHEDQYGDIWIGSATKGLWKIRDGEAKSYVNKEEAHRNEVHAIAAGPDGTIWVGTSFGLGRYNRSRDNFTWFTRRDGLSGSVIANIAFDKAGNLYAGTLDGGLNYYDGKTFRHLALAQGTSMVGALHYSRYYDALFAGSEFGISVLQDGRLEPIYIPELENTSVISIHSFRDSLLLIGSGGAGVTLYNRDTRARKMITTHHGLPSDFIYFVAADPDDYLWIGTEKGISRLKLDSKLDILENLHFDYNNGLTGVETNQNAFYLSDDLKLFGLIDGLYQFNALKRHERKSFDLHLTSVELFYGEYDVSKYADSVFSFFKLPWKPQLPPDANHITFDFNRVDKSYSNAVKFRYLLENFDKTWSQPSSVKEVTYSNLPPGHYTFHVVATDSRGSWSPAVLAYGFTVQAPFYKTASFIVGMFILLAGGATLIVYVRVRNRVNKLVMLERFRLREQEALRKEIARDFHDEMGNQLTRIINYISLLKLNGATGKGNRADLYEKVEDSAKYLYTGTRDFIWSIDPGNDELSKLFIHIRDFGEKLFEEKEISFRAFNEVKEKCKLPYGFSREANLIFKEAMTNAFKYSAAANVSFSLVRVGDAFEMSLEDDGIGFYTGDIERSNGLKNIRERADRIRAVLRIQSVKTKGTRIVLHFKLNKTLKYGLTF